MTKLQTEFEKLFHIISPNELQRNPSLKGPISKIRNLLGTVQGEDGPLVRKSTRRKMLEFLDIHGLKHTLI